MKETARAVVGVAGIIAGASIIVVAITTYTVLSVATIGLASVGWGITRLSQEREEKKILEEHKNG